VRNKEKKKKEIKTRREVKKQEDKK